jgi:hypothetical protein
MQKKLAKLFLPAAIALFICAPAFAQRNEGTNHGEARAQMPHNAPPRSKTEKRTERPSQNHKWIGGNWEPQNDTWAWAPGRWEEPTEKGNVWTKAKYHREKEGYRYEAGHWSH